MTLDPEGVLHVVEVKSWADSEIKHPLESLTYKKQERSRNAVLRLLGELDRERTDPAASLYSLLSEIQGEFAVSFDLLWVKPENEFEYFQELF